MTLVSPAIGPSSKLPEVHVNDVSRYVEGLALSQKVLHILVERGQLVFSSTGEIIYRAFSPCNPLPVLFYGIPIDNEMLIAHKW